ncbi:MAG: hypothetical protein CL908_05005 [Deltaproteobacteria bacterium]|nr:hypothetical protein [Deltaproteobacteria bacterium]
MQSSPLDAPFGVRIHLDSDQPLDEAERSELRRLYAAHGLLVVRDHDISPEQQVDLLAPLGRIEPDETGRPMLMEVTNQHDQTSAPAGEIRFHFDYAYDPAPVPGISLYGSLIDGDVTSTCFVSSSSVLDRLPPDLVERLRGLDAAHTCFLRRLDAPKERSVEPDPLIPRGQEGWGPEHYWTNHPVIWKNVFGEETLFVCLEYTDRILGLPRAESDALLEELYTHLYDPAYVYEHRWRTHDLVIFDNITLQHARLSPNDRPRTLRRFHLSDTDLTADYLRVAREKRLV